MSILQNEKYKGDNLAGKTFKPDVLSPKRIKNEGQSTQYYHENSHPAIITKELFELVQAEIARRKNLRANSKTGLENSVVNTRSAPYFTAKSAEVGYEDMPTITMAK